MPSATQAKLLRVLEERKLRRLGARIEQDVDVRVLSATNRDPEQAVAQGHLRADLFYRLNVFNIHMPALREHMEDLPAMADLVAERTTIIDSSMWEVPGIRRVLGSRAASWMISAAPAAAMWPPRPSPRRRRTRSGVCAHA